MNLDETQKVHEGRLKKENKNRRGLELKKMRNEEQHARIYHYDSRKEQKNGTEEATRDKQ